MISQKKKKLCKKKHVNFLLEGKKAFETHWGDWAANSAGLRGRVKFKNSSTQYNPLSAKYNFNTSH